MKKLLLNPYVIIGAVLGGLYLMRKKSDTKAAQVLGEVIEGGESIASTLADTAVSLTETTIDSNYLKAISGLYDFDTITLNLYHLTGMISNN